MVMSLNAPTCDDLAYTTKVIEERKRGSNKNYFNNISPIWLDRVNIYNNNNGDPKKIPPSPIAEKDKDKFINLYEYKDEKYCHVKFISNLRKPKKKFLLCPACGEDGTPRTLDHYLPKDLFPEFAIHLKNLVPMCDICQEIKGVKYVDEHGNKKFIHSYFDEINQPLFEIKIHSPFNAPQKIELCLHSQLSKNLNTLVQNHLNGLSLKDRIEDYCKTKYLHLLKLTALNRARGKRSVKEMLEEFLWMDNQKAINSWGAIFYRSVLENDGLMNYLQNEDLPQFLDTSVIP